jgi:hypothetical protein
MKALSLARKPPPRGRRGGDGGSGAETGWSESRALRGDHRRFEDGGGGAAIAEALGIAPASGVFGLSKLMDSG